MRRRVICVFIGLCCTLLAGCHQKVSTNEGLEISFQLWVPLLIVLAGIAAIPVGIVLIAKNHRFRGILLSVAGPLAAVAVAPGVYLDRVIVNQEGFYSRYGFWWNPTIHQIRYDDLQLVRVSVEEKTSRRGKRYNYYFDCTLKSGKQERISIGDLMQDALPEVTDQFKKHGVPVEIPPNLPK